MQLATPPPRSTYARFIRPALGALLVASLAVPVGACVVVIAAAQLLTQRRPRQVFFVQERAGRYGKPFRIVKFRTLEPNAEGGLRPTRLGRVLRKTHFDELPQLWNVVKGEMSLIGPRPESLAIEDWAAKRIPGFTERLAIRPGITGWAQVVQDSTPPIEVVYLEKLRLNEEYLASMGLRKDVEILVRTALRPFRPRQFGPPDPERSSAQLKAG